jgi:tetratricopeptide (TPR) repeat protein
MDKEKAMQEKNWLVKSSSKIIGPYSAMEIAQLLIKKHVSIIDEVRQPRGRWAYIRETPIFSEVVSNLRTEQANTMEETASVLTTHTLTKTDVVPPMPDLTPTPIMESNYGDVYVRDVAPTPAPVKAPEVKSYGMAQDQRIQKQLKKKTKSFGAGLWLLVLLVAVGVGYYYMNKFRGPGTDYKFLSEQALRYKHLHLYEKAIESYKKAQLAKEPDPKLAFEMAPLLIQIEKQTLQGRRILMDGLNNDALTRDQKVEGYLSVGISYVIDGDLKSAQEFYEKALSYDPNNVPTFIDMAYNEIRKGDLVKAADIFKNIPPSATHQPFILLGRGLLAAEMRRSKSLDDLDNLLKSSLAVSQPLRKELALVYTYLSFLEKNDEEYLNGMKSYVDIPLGQSDEFALDPRIDSRIADWDNLEKYCLEIANQSNPSSVNRAFRAMCLLEENRDGESKKLIDEAIVENPKDPYVRIVQAQQLMKLNKNQEALTILKSINQSELKSVNLLQGRVCKALNDKKCATESFEASLRQNPNDVSSASEVAAIYLEKGSVVEARGIIKAGLERFGSHKPLIELREKLENP